MSTAFNILCMVADATLQDLGGNYVMARLNGTWIRPENAQQVSLAVYLRSRKWTTHDYTRKLLGQENPCYRTWIPVKRDVRPLDEHVKYAHRDHDVPGGYLVGNPFAVTGRTPTKPALQVHDGPWMRNRKDDDPLPWSDTGPFMRRR